MFPAGNIAISFAAAHNTAFVEPGNTISAAAHNTAFAAAHGTIARRSNTRMSRPQPHITYNEFNNRSDAAF